ncbi:MAG: flagellar brake protein [Desulfovibrio sp.]|nr:MAG: flagellar brake protein [Desulfovibrio sp.]
MTVVFLLFDNFAITEQSMDKPVKTLAWNLDMPIGLDLIAQVKGTDNVRFRSRYLGMKAGEFLIMQMPGVPSIREKLVSHCNLVVRFMSSGTVFGFESSVQATTMRPSPMMFIAFPDTIESLNLRQAERVDTFINAEGTIGEQIVRGAILDISAGGCRYTIDRSTGTRWPDTEPGTQILLSFTLPSTEIHLHVNGEIINAKKDIDTIILGVKFILDEYHEDVKQQITDFVRNTIVYMKGKGN